MSIHATTHAKWFCEGHSAAKSPRSSACPDCCGFIEAPPAVYHLGRSWIGHEIENACDCPKAACGLVIAERMSNDLTCDQHGLEACRTMRQVHSADMCPATGGQR